MISITPSRVHSQESFQGHPSDKENFIQKVSGDDALTVAEHFTKARNLHIKFSTVEPFTNGDDTLAWVFRCSPSGFIILSANTSMTPVLAWSVESNFGVGLSWETFLPILRSDLVTRNRFAGADAIESINNRQKWDYWMTSDGNHLFGQWPPAGWSPTGGWLFTNWTQTAPYNDLCPVDGNTSTRSVAGCPATAMAQIVNFHQEIHNTRFSDADDYYHNFGSGNQYQIDDDWATFGFPSWDQLNMYLDTLELHYQDSITLSNNDMAALTYACGVSARQVYSSSVSGTYGINQAYDAFIRFGYSDAQLVYPSDSTLTEHLSENIKSGLPAHLGLVDPGNTVGHNVVVDGYNTDELYHFNFGWGGSANGWYTMPPSSIPYNLTVIEGVVMDINLSALPSGISSTNSETNQQMWYISVSAILRIGPGRPAKSDLKIYDLTGRIMMHLSIPASFSYIDVPLTSLKPGIYIARLTGDNGANSVCKFNR